MKRFISKLGAAVTAVLALIAVVVALLGIAVTIPRDGPYKVLIVRSGSMEPTVPVGSLVVAEKQTSYGVGDIVTFKQEESFVTHRITAAYDGKFWTKGDANTSPDGSPVPYSAVVGKLRWTLPYAGYIVTFAKTPLGFSLLIVFPALLIVIQEILAIGRELEKEQKRRLLLRKIFDIRRVPSPWALAREAAREGAASRRRIAQAVSMLLVALVAGVGGTKAYFSDVATSTGNVFTAGTFQAVTLVINEVMPDTSCFVGNTEAQWIEVYNGYTTTVNLKNFKLVNGNTNATIDLVTANKNIAPGQFVLIAHSSAIWGTGPNKCFNNNGADTANFGGQFNIDVGHLQLKDASGAVIDTVKWGTQAPSLAPAQNQSIERNPDGRDTASGTNFNPADFVVRTTPQPGL